MDVSQFTGERDPTTASRVLCENNMKFDSHHTAIIPSLSVRFETGDTLDDSRCPYLFRSVCCCIVAPICYSWAGCCCLCGTWCFFMDKGNKPNFCCTISDRVCNNTTQWGTHTCWYDNICGSSSNNGNRFNFDH